MTESPKDPLFIQEHRIGSYEVDVRGMARPSVLFSYMVDVAWNHIESTEFSFSELRSKEQLWVASKVFILFNQFPKWNEKVI